MKSECSTTFEVNKTFKKKVTLPPLSKWKVAESDSLMSGSLQSVIRTKGLIFKHTSLSLPRYINITKQGFMIVYDGEDKGYVLDLTATAAVKTKASKGLSQMHCTVALKMSYGTFTMIIWGAEGQRWIEAIHAVVIGNKHSRGTGASLNPKPTNLAIADSSEESKEDGFEYDDSSASVRTFVAEEGVISSAKTPEMSSKTLVKDSQPISEFYLPSSIVIPLDEDSIRSKTPPTVIEVKPEEKRAEIQVLLPSTPMLLAKDASLWRRPAVHLPSTLASEAEESVTESIRCGPESVATLRQKLESKTRVSWRKTRKQRRPTMLDHPLVPTEEMKTTRLIVKKAASAPAVVKEEKAAPRSSRKSIATMSYDGCFDSIRA